MLSCAEGSLAWTPLSRGGRHHVRAPISRNFPAGQQRGSRGPARAPPLGRTATQPSSHILGCGLPDFLLLLWSRRSDNMRSGCQSLGRSPLSKMLPRLPDGGVLKLSAETTCGCRRPGPGGAAQPGPHAPARRSSLPAPRATSLRAAVPARRRGARALARSPLALPSSSLLPPASSRGMAATRSP